MRITPTLELICHECGWRPKRNQTMGEVQDHFNQHHGGAKVTLDLSAVCTCGKEMRASHTTSQGRMFQDNFVCDCGNIGFLLRGANS